MLPSSIIALAILIVAVLPGAAYTWTYEREAASFGVTAADRTLRLIGVLLLLAIPAACGIDPGPDEA